VGKYWVYWVYWAKNIPFYFSSESFLQKIVGHKKKGEKTLQQIVKTKIESKLMEKHFSENRGHKKKKRGKISLTG